MLIDTNDIVYIPQEQNQKNSSTYLERGDLILSKTAYPTASFVNIDGCNTSQDTIAIKLKRDSQLLSHYLTIFLNTKTGLEQMGRWFTGNIQMHLNLTDCKDKILIPIFSNIFQLKMKYTLEKSILSSNNQSTLYQQAEALLLKELGLENFKPTEQAVNIKSFKDSFETTGRLDSEYYQLKYEDYLALIKKYPKGYDSLINIITLKDKNYTPKEYQQYQYIELSNVGSLGDITDCTLDEGCNLPSRARRLVSKGDVIISSIEGSLASCAIVTAPYDKSICSTGFYVINSQYINSETLLVLFKSSLMQNLLKQNCSGTILTAINKDEFSNLLIPIVDVNTQHQIAELIQQSFALKAQSEHLLEIAKQAVEMAIEQDEEKALAFIEQNSPLTVH